jgi:hypothetical protein
MNFSSKYLYQNSKVLFFGNLQKIISAEFPLCGQANMPYVNVIVNVGFEKDFLKNLSQAVAKYLKKPESVGDEENIRISIDILSSMFKWR